MDEKIANDVKAGLAHVIDRLRELEARARKLDNQNFADLIKGAFGRLMQASEHPDLPEVQERMNSNDDAQGNLRFDPDAPGTQQQQPADPKNVPYVPQPNPPFDPVAGTVVDPNAPAA